ncbi:MAG: aldehyde ferredoxin oxidoreductase C-terminal domain-containing protein, partial [Thermodesulfobacteriota bacterium]
MDTISCGVTIGFTYFLYEKGIIGESDVEGLN